MASPLPALGSHGEPDPGEGGLEGSGLRPTQRQEPEAKARAGRSDPNEAGTEAGQMASQPFVA